MHKLQRGKAPACLSKFHPDKDNWDSLTSVDRSEIWKELEAMQGNRCSYCEAAVKTSSRHIEHFRQKGRDRRVTFLWSNLFGSCNNEKSCGKHKDKLPTYRPEDLIKPDEEDPEDFFLFVSDGTIVVRQGLNARDQQRAKETLRIFNLDEEWGPLRNMRKQAAIGYLKTLQGLIDELSPEEFHTFIEIERAATAHLPFATAIKHVLTNQSRTS